MRNRTLPAISLFLLAGCARMEPPPGGPEDRIRPFVAGVYPAPGAVNVPRELKARIAFSEWVNKDVERGKVWLSPPPAKKLQVRVEGNVLAISSASPLDTGTTYVLGVSGTVRDLNGQPLEAPFQLAFSTGPILDSGRLSGRLAVFPGTAPSPGAFAALYPLDQALRNRFGHLFPRPGLPVSPLSPQLSRADSAPHPFREKPAYLSPADSLGRFGLEGVRPGRYLLVGFQDVNQDLGPDPGSEMLGVGPMVAVATGEGPAQSLALAAFDTVPARLLEARWSHERMASGRTLGTVRLKFSRPVHPGRGLRRELYSVRRAPSGAGRGQAGKAGAAPQAGVSAPVPVVDICLNPESGEVELYTAPLEPESSYTVQCAAVPDFQGNPIDTSRDEAPFRASLTADSGRAPSPATPAGPGASAAPEVPTPAAPIFLGRRRISGIRDRLGRDHVMPARGMLAYYPRILTDSVLADLGARLEVKADTVPVAFFISRVSHHEFSLKLGPLSLRGQALHIGYKGPKPTGAAAGAPPGPESPASPDPSKVPASPPGPKATFFLADSAKLGSLLFHQDASAQGSLLVLRNHGEVLEYTIATPARDEFGVDSLPAGKYSVEYFRDEDRDSIWSPGRIRPWTPQETFVHYADSVEVRPGGVSAVGGASGAGPSGRRLSFPPIW